MDRLTLSDEQWNRVAPHPRQAQKHLRLIGETLHNIDRKPPGQEASFGNAEQCNGQ